MSDTSHVFRGDLDTRAVLTDEMYLKECYNPDPWLLAPGLNA